MSAPNAGEKEPNAWGPLTRYPGWTAIAITLVIGAIWLGSLIGGASH